MRTYLITLLLLTLLTHADTHIYENGSSTQSNWQIYTDDKSPTVQRVYDPTLGSHVIEFKGSNGVGDGFRVEDNWNEQEQSRLSWKLNYSEPFTFYVDVETEDHGRRYIIYKPQDNYQGINERGHIQIALGQSAMNGTWQSFSRNLAEDIQQYHSGYQLQSVLRVIIRGSGKLDDIQLSSTSKLNKIFVIGDSTVHYTNTPLDLLGGERMGWAQQLQLYADDDVKIGDHARRGASSENYKTNDPTKRDGIYWETTYQSMMDWREQGGSGYLFIQLGGNDPHYGVTEAQFKQNLRDYANQAKALGIIPVFITPPTSRRINDTSRDQYATYIKELANAEEILLLDLTEYSQEKYKEYGEETDNNGYLIEAELQLGGTDIYRGTVDNPTWFRDDHNHFNPHGANRVAGWIKALACSENAELCSLFK